MKREVNKEDVLSDLYALRAGLSLISQSADELSAAEEERNTKSIQFIMENEWCIDGYCLEGSYVVEWVCGRYDRDKLDKLDELKKKAGCRDEDWEEDDWPAQELEKGEKVFGLWLNTDEAVKETKKNKEKYQQVVSSSNSEIKRNKISTIIFAVASIISLIMLLMAFVLIAVVKGEAGVVLLPIGVVLFAVSAFICSRMKRRTRENNDRIRWAQDTILKIEDTEKRIKEYRQVLSQIEEEKTAPIIAYAKETYKVMYPSLLKTFNKVLDERDWKYVDLIIYYFETGRADDMKEALHLLEREIQTNRIIGVIADATECICATVERVATRISVQLGVISSQLSQIAELQQIQVTQNSELISQTKMQNALIAKSNVTSEKLMQDVKYIKGYCKK